ncbi:hypothetical protein [Streptomyces sp. NRRL F-5650]|uniref:hypothetical protein n=1 Tax=Streptomyces sp. NRRL F-5650 TaxID=1463868 RepID=UPI0005639E24|nr:hypothetical protein [Streptomyces sp. NRRL F-5650]
MTVEHRWLLDETPWPEQAALVYGEMVELTTPHPPIPQLGGLGPEIIGSRGVVVACVIEQDERDGHVRPLYAVETEDGSPWRLRPEFLVSRGGLHPDMPPRYRSDLPEGTHVRIRLESDKPGATMEAVGEVTGIWRTTCLEPPKGYMVQVGEHLHCVTPQQTEVL